MVEVLFMLALFGIGIGLGYHVRAAPGAGFWDKCVTFFSPGKPQ